MVTTPRKNTRKGQAEADTSKAQQAKRHERRKSWFSMELNRQQTNRFQMALDEAYYDGDQWTQAEAAEVRARGQNPVVFNNCKPLCDFMIGTERRTRFDFLVMNRSEGSEEAYRDAENKTKLLKFIDDLNRTQFERSESADDQFKAGLGWMEIGIRSDPTGWPIYKRYESWRNMLYDSLGKSRLPRDWRYCIRFKEVDFDIAEAMFPNRVDDLRKCVINGDQSRHMDWHSGAPLTGMMASDTAMMAQKWITYDADAWLNNPRERILLIEFWSNDPYPIKADDFNGIEGEVVMRKRCAIMTEFDTLIESWSPYNHDQYPFVPQWCYRRKKDGAPYGMIRQQRGPQDSLNKHMSKAQFRIAARQVMLERGALDPAVMDLEQLEDLIGDPSSVMEFARGAISGGKVKIVEGVQLAQADIALAERMAATIHDSSGVSPEDRGRDNDVSGLARRLRLQQGSLLTAEPFDNIMQARQLEGEITLSLAEQCHVDPMTFAYRTEGKKAEYIAINQPDPNNPGQYLNDITKRKATFVIGEAPWQQSLAESSFEAMMAMLGEIGKVAPAVVTSVLDLAFELHPSLPKKHAILRRIRQATGVDDPDEADTPQAQQAREQKAKMAQMQFELQMAQVRADVRKAEATGEKITAEAMSKRLEALYIAAQAAQILTTAPQIAPVADELAMSTGFQDMHGQPIIGGEVPIQGSPAHQSNPMPLQADGALAGHQAGIVSPAITGVQPEIPQS